MVEPVVSKLTLPREGSLVLYKMRPARVQRADDRLTIELEGGEALKVRPKDVALLHPGPLSSLNELRPQPGEVQAAWELLVAESEASGQVRTTLAELAELAYGAYIPATAWAAWQLVADGLYFRGNLEEITVSTPEEVAQVQAARELEAAEKRAWEGFTSRARAGKLAPEDSRYLSEVEALAYGRTARSRVLRESGREETPENAHAMLLELGWWTPAVNPYPQRLGLTTTPSDLDLPPLPDEPRLDLTHLPAFAIDDAGSDTPDDALSLEGGRLWVHVADVAALVRPDSPIDLEARARGATNHLPEQVVPMLPPAATPLLGLGLAETSPALSFGLDLDPAGQIVGLEVVPSWVRVTRLTYDEVEGRLDEEPFRDLYCLTQAYQARRAANGAVSIDLPEVSVRVKEGQVILRRLPPLQSRALVEGTMIMAGEAVARFAIERGIPLPFATQEPPDPHEAPRTLSAMFALRRTLKRSQYRSIPAPHGGLGLSAYSQATSPLRRYLDLVVHQQLRAYLRGEQLLSEQDVLERVGAIEAIIGNVRQAERLSNTHWTLVYLLQHPKWRGEGIVVEKAGLNESSVASLRGNPAHTLRGRLLIPELGLETQMQLPADLPLDASVPLAVSWVDLPHLDVRFRTDFSRTAHSALAGMGRTNKELLC